MQTEVQEVRPFKRCPLCQHAWPRLVDLVEDTNLEPTGYQAVFDEPEMGLFLMLHRHDGCYTTIGVRAGLLRHFYAGEEASERLSPEQGCPGHCLDAKNLEPCERACSLAWVREVLQCLRRHQLPAHLTNDAVEADGAS